MLNIPSQSFPAPSSQQRVSSAQGRSKVPLKPGRSLMDWIRLTKSGKDLTGLKGRLIEVTEEELARHNKNDDCWICIRGLVYNVTPYMEYHPGGEDELMKAAGMDGTDLFDQVHRWVNYESMLKECLIGKMAMKAVTATKVSDSHLSMKGKPVGNGEKVSDQLSQLPFRDGMLPKPRYDWFQNDMTVSVVIYAKQKEISSECIIVDLDDHNLRVELLLGVKSYLLHLKLFSKVEDDIKVITSYGIGKIELNMKKKSCCKWTELGTPLIKHDMLIETKNQEIFYRKCTLISVCDVTHDTKLYHLQLPRGTVCQVPVGKHIYLKTTYKDGEIVKPYTPVCETLISKDTECDKNIFLIIKIYCNGIFTSHIANLQPGDTLYMSNPEGKFNVHSLQGVTDLWMLAAGTGFTPMIKLIKYAFKNISALRKINLVFYNKTEKDIIWQSHLEQLSAEDERFKVEFVLSEPPHHWTGKRGTIEVSHISDLMSQDANDSKCFVCICGPIRFTEKTLMILQELEFSEEKIHAFLE
ncbi:cytochrome b5 reductase 4 isoform X1 [Polypterus senegalus]|uniref:cytochrome b5 reductase 4 isoform X1 n=2 Tax=Polypterus senegalus TaxID=55291 RepID=UPI0019667479|nr:cytochrome b5 reductase 4 isoform X1 [Polypterus senegalus]